MLFRSEYSLKVYERLNEKLKQGIVAEQEKDDSKKGLEVAREKYQAEKKNLELLKAGTRIEDIEIAAARLAQGQAELKRLTAGPREEELDQARAFKEECEARLKRIQIQLEERQIISPGDVRVEVCDFEPGDILAPGQIAAILLKPNDMWVKIYVKEHDLNKVDIGQKVEALVEFNNEKNFKSWFLRKVFSSMAEPSIAKKFDGQIIHISSDRKSVV